MFGSNINKILTVSGKIKVTGGEVFYKKLFAQSTKAQSALVVVHGGPGVPHGYLNVFEKLAETRPVIFYDQLGCGLSDKPNDDALWQMQRFADELRDVSQSLNLSEMHLFGHSWGAAIIHEHALKFPQQVKSLTLASPLICAHKTVSDTYRLLNQLPEKIKITILDAEKKEEFDSKEYIEARTEYMKRFLFRGTIPESLLEALKNTNNHIQHVLWGKATRLLKGVLLNYDRSKELRSLKMPVLVTCGAFDFPQPDSLAEYVKGMENVTLKVFEQSAHMPHLEEEKEYMQEFTNFLDEVDKKCEQVNCMKADSSPSKSLL